MRMLKGPNKKFDIVKVRDSGRRLIAASIVFPPTKNGIKSQLHPPLPFLFPPEK